QRPFLESMAAGGRRDADRRTGGDGLLPAALDDPGSAPVWPRLGGARNGRAARHHRRGVRAAGEGRLVKIALVAPTCADSPVPRGGGERSVEALARALADRARVRLVSFARHARTERPRPGLERRILRSWTRDPVTPFSPRLASAIGHPDVLHLFQYHTLPTFLGAWIGHRRRARVVVTDLGGGGWTPGYQIDVSRWIDA